MTTDSIISKVWSFCTTLRDDGVGYGDYLEQLTYYSYLALFCLVIGFLFTRSDPVRGDEFSPRRRE